MSEIYFFLFVETVHRRCNVGHRDDLRKLVTVFILRIQENLQESVVIGFIDYYKNGLDTFL